MFEEYSDSKSLEPNLSEIIVKSYEGGVIEDDSNINAYGSYQGTGTLVLDDECLYTGHFSKGLFHNKGEFCWSSENITYEGDFDYGDITGKGEYKWSDGSTYLGEVKDGLRDGHGVFRNSAGQMYDGNWKLGKQHGQGKYWYDRSGSIIYNGEWNMGFRNGYGTMRYNNGNTYEGYWSNNRKHGYGIMIWKDVGEIYSGQWKDDIPDGLGEYIWGCYESTAQRPTWKQHCNIYRGDFVNGERHGVGSFFYANGSQYSGQWCNGKKHGEGLFRFLDGRIFVGLFYNDRIDDSTDLSNVNTEYLLPYDPNPVNIQFKLNIDDVLLAYIFHDKNFAFSDVTLQQYCKDETKEIERILLRYNSYLRKHYKKLVDSTTQTKLKHATYHQYYDENIINISSWSKIAQVMYFNRQFNKSCLYCASFETVQQLLIELNLPMYAGTSSPIEAVSEHNNSTLSNASHLSSVSNMSNIQSNAANNKSNLQSAPKSLLSCSHALCYQDIIHLFQSMKANHFQVISKRQLDFRDKSVPLSSYLSLRYRQQNYLSKSAAEGLNTLATTSTLNSDVKSLLLKTAAPLKAKKPGSKQRTRMLSTTAESTNTSSRRVSKHNGLKASNSKKGVTITTQSAKDSILDNTANSNSLSFSKLILDLKDIDGDVDKLIDSVDVNPFEILPLSESLQQVDDLFDHIYLENSSTSELSFGKTSVNEIVSSLKYNDPRYPVLECDFMELLVRYIAENQMRFWSFNPDAVKRGFLPLSKIVYKVLAEKIQPILSDSSLIPPSISIYYHESVQEIIMNIDNQRKLRYIWSKYLVVDNLINQVVTVKDFIKLLNSWKDAPIPIVEENQEAGNDLVDELPRAEQSIIAIISDATMLNYFTCLELLCYNTAATEGYVDYSVLAKEINFCDYLMLLCRVVNSEIWMNHLLEDKNAPETNQGVEESKLSAYCDMKSSPRIHAVSSHQHVHHESDKHNKDSDKLKFRLMKFFQYLQVNITDE